MSSLICTTSSTSPLAIPTPNEIVLHQKELHSLTKPKPKIASTDLNDLGGHLEGHANTSCSDSISSQYSPLFILSFSNLTYSVKAQQHHKWMYPVFQHHKNSNPSSEQKLLLDDVSGEAREGEILAVLGPSGSGKSTLIDALADQISKGSLKGTKTFNGEALESNLLRAISAYVMQDDLLFPMLTVEETLMFAAEFRLPRSLSKARKKARVQALMTQLGLNTAASTMIGDEGHRGVSGGERRRVSIGIDIIHDPILLFLDEPTSGLDSSNALMVVKVLKSIAKSGSTVVMSIHQPSSRILVLFDKLIFLSCGRTVYSGSPDHIPQFFAEFGHPVPHSENRAEFVLDLILQLEKSPGGTKNLVDFNKLRQNRTMSPTSSSSTANEAIAASVSKGKLTIDTDQNPSSVPTYANPMWIEMYVIAKRSILNSLRIPKLFGIRLGVVLLTGLILATVFWRLDATPRGADERLSFFVLAISTTFYSCAEALPKFVEQRFIFARETAFRAYRRGSYVLSHTLTAIPALALLSVTFTSATYWAVGLSGGYLSYFLFIFAAFWAGHSFVTLLSGVITNVMFGYSAVVAILANFVLFSGFFVSRDRIPGYWLWFHYGTVVKYPYQGVLQGEFGGGRCFARGWEMFDTTPFQGVAEELKEEMLEAINGVLGGRRRITGRTCVMTGMDVLRRQGADDVTMWGCLWITIGWGVLFRVLFYLALMFCTNKNHRK